MLIKEESGCKVGWKWYSTESEAKAAAKKASAEADKLAAQGYDFGYQVPGSMRKNDDGTFVVTVP